MFALVDCNNFYCSCERVFRPDLHGKPIVVLSNNDGCIIARSEEAKQLGATMAAPWFKHAKALRTKGITVFSSNYPLYGDLSTRVMDTLDTFKQPLEIYSIDEAFLELKNFQQHTLQKYAQAIRTRVQRWTGIPVSIGLAPTKTLAKVASRIGKKHSACNGVYQLPTHDPAAMKRLLEATSIRDVWGIGHRTADMLARFGIHSAAEFCHMTEGWVQQRMTITGLRTHRELRGIPCLPLESLDTPRRTVLSSRSFGTPVNNHADLAEAIASFTACGAHKLRRAKLYASIITVFIKTNPHSSGPQYRNKISYTFTEPLDDTPTLIRTAQQLLDEIYKGDMRYQKAGIILSGLRSPEGSQRSLLTLATKTDEKNKRFEKLTRVADEIAARYGSKKVQYAAEGLNTTWGMRQRHLSPRYTTDWDDIPIVS